MMGDIFWYGTVSACLGPQGMMGEGRGRQGMAGNGRKYRKIVEDGGGPWKTTECRPVDLLAHVRLFLGQ